MANKFDERIAKCSCGSEDVFMRRCCQFRSDKFSLKCNFCQTEQEKMYPSWDEAIAAWNGRYDPNKEDAK